MDSEDSDSDMSATVPKVDNRTPCSKPSSSGPSASRIAAQNKKTVTPEVGLKASKVYKRSSSPTYLITSSGASECHSDHDEDDSDITFDILNRLLRKTKKCLPNLVNLELLNMV